MTLEPEILFIGGFALIAFIWVLLEELKKQRIQKSQKYQEGYDEKRGNIQAEEDHKKEQKIKEENKKWHERGLDILFGKSR